MRNKSAKTGIIRQMRLQDIPEMMKTENVVYSHPWTAGIFQDCITAGYHCYVMEENDEIMAYGVLSFGVDEAHLLNVTVAEKHQGKGVGRRMVTHFMQMARKGSAESIFLEVRPSNKRAFRLYESLGFIQVGIRKDYYPDGLDKREDALVLECQLVD